MIKHTRIKDDTRSSESLFPGSIRLTKTEVLNQQEEARIDETMGPLTLTNLKRIFFLIGNFEEIWKLSTMWLFYPP